MRDERTHLQEQGLMHNPISPYVDLLTVCSWLGELEGSCSQSRAIELAAGLSKSLSKFMGIDNEMLCAALVICTESTMPGGATSQRTIPC